MSLGEETGPAAVPARKPKQTKTEDNPTAEVKKTDRITAAPASLAGRSVGAIERAASADSAKPSTGRRSTGMGRTLGPNGSRLVRPGWGRSDLR